MFEFLTWLLTIAAIIGVVLNIQKKQICFYIWAITNASWATIDFYKGIPAQGVLFTVYFGLAIWGIFKWRQKKSPAHD